MASEYKKLDHEQIIYTQKSLLQAQLESLTSIKQIRNYKALRHEELMEKINMKKILDELNKEVEVLLRMLPEPSYEQEEVIPGVEKARPQSHALEEELDMIKAKLAALQ
jgi:predicted nuclease with TOPRIM domain